MAWRIGMGKIGVQFGLLGYVQSYGTKTKLNCDPRERLAIASTRRK